MVGRRFQRGGMCQIVPSPPVSHLSSRQDFEGPSGGTAPPFAAMPRFGHTRFAPKGSIIGTSALRRQAMLVRLTSDNVPPSARKRGCCVIFACTTVGAKIPGACLQGDCTLLNLHPPPSSPSLSSPPQRYVTTKPTEPRRTSAAT